MQNQFIQITNKNKQSLTEINENVFSAVEWYNEVTKWFIEKWKLHTNVSSSKYSRKTNESAMNYASNVVWKIRNFKNCNFCTRLNFKVNHSIFMLKF